MSRLFGTLNRTCSNTTGKVSVTTVSAVFQVPSSAKPLDLEGRYRQAARDDKPATESNCPAPGDVVGIALMKDISLCSKSTKPEETASENGAYNLFVSSIQIQLD